MSKYTTYLQAVLVIDHNKKDGSDIPQHVVLRAVRELYNDIIDAGTHEPYMETLSTEQNNPVES